MSYKSWLNIVVAVTGFVVSFIKILLNILGDSSGLIGLPSQLLTFRLKSSMVNN